MLNQFFFNEQINKLFKESFSQGAYLTVELVFEEWRLDAWDYSVWLDARVEHKTGKVYWNYIMEHHECHINA